MNRGITTAFALLALLPLAGVAGADNRPTAPAKEGFRTRGFRDGPGLRAPKGFKFVRVKCRKGKSWERLCIWKLKRDPRIPPPGSDSCPRGTYYYARKCQPNSQFVRWAKLQSRIPTDKGKACHFTFPHRSGGYCFVCPSGKYWSKGKCVGSSGCPLGVDLAARACRTRSTSGGNCRSGQYYWGGKCRSYSEMRQKAQSMSRLFTATFKTCHAAFPYRSGEYCYVCPSGKYWSNGSCVPSSGCSNGIDYTGRACKASGSGSATCRSGDYYWGGKCQSKVDMTRMASTRSRLYTYSSNPCHYAFPHRSGNYCYVCRPGRYWSNGSCVSSSKCTSGVDNTARKCKGVGAYYGTSGGTGVACGSGYYYWGGKCRSNAEMTRKARTQSRLYTTNNKSCHYAFPHRSGTYCYVCRVGQYWNNGSCVTSCASGRDYVQRKCRTSRSNYRPINNGCRPGWRRSGNKCVKCPAGTYPVGGGKCCRYGCYRSGNVCRCPR